MACLATGAPLPSMEYGNGATPDLHEFRLTDLEIEEKEQGDDDQRKRQFQ